MHPRCRFAYVSVCEHAVVNGAGGSGRGARPFVIGGAVLAGVILVGVVGSALSTPTADAAYDLTGGRWGADLTTGILLLIVPIATIIGYAVLARRRGWRQWPGWWLLLLYLPAFELEPFSRSGTDTTMEEDINSRLPGLLGGMGIGVLVLMMCVAGLVLAGHRHRGRTR